MATCELEPAVGTVVLNWMRPDNIEPVVASLWRQRPRPTVWLWNNNPDHVGRPFPCDHRVDAPENLKCWPRWLMMSLMPCEYVFSWDDDHLMCDEHVLRDALALAKRIEASGCRKYAVGCEGLRLTGTSYAAAERISRHPADDTPVDLVLGRFLLCRRDLLEGVQLGDRMHCQNQDDIRVSALAEQCWVIGGLAGRTRELRAAGESLCAQPGHFALRDQAAKRFFPYKFAKACRPSP